MSDSLTTPARLPRSLSGLELALTGHRRDVRRRLRVSDEELTVLLHLAHAGGARQPGLAALTGLSRSGTGALVQRLEQAGLVERRPDPDDRRLRRVELTRGGTARLAHARNGLGTTLDRLAESRAPEDLAALERLLSELTAQLDALAEEPRVVQPSDAALDPVWRRWA